MFKGQGLFYNCKVLLVSGICHGLLSGAKEISYAVENQHGYSTVQTGYYSSFHIFIEELRVESVETCFGHPSTCWSVWQLLKI